MAIIGNFFIKLMDTKEKIQVYYYDTISVSITTITFKDLLKQTFKMWHSFLFKINKSDSEHIYELIDYNGYDIFKQHNDYLNSQGLESVTYNPILGEKEKPKYIG
jgi:hypothetical protein